MSLPLHSSHIHDPCDRDDDNKLAAAAAALNRTTTQLDASTEYVLELQLALGAALAEAAEARRALEEVWRALEETKNDGAVAKAELLEVRAKLTVAMRERHLMAMQLQSFAGGPHACHYRKVEE